MDINQKLYVKFSGIRSETHLKNDQLKDVFPLNYMDMTADRYARTEAEALLATGNNSWDVIHPIEIETTLDRGSVDLINIFYRQDNRIDEINIYRITGRMIEDPFELEIGHRLTLYRTSIAYYNCSSTGHGNQFDVTLKFYYREFELESYSVVEEPKINGVCLAHNNMDQFPYSEREYYQLLEKQGRELANTPPEPPPEPEVKFYQPPEPKKKPPKKKIVIQVGVFFDGTGQDMEIEDQLSNIAKLYRVYPEDLDDYRFGRHYEQGVGTGDNLLVNLYTANLAGQITGAFGYKRLRRAISYIEDIIVEGGKKYQQDQISITLDIFGFSRGAALARHFVNVIYEKAYRFSSKSDSFDKNRIKVRFLGIFDSVGSFGMPGDNVDQGYQFHIDSRKAEYVYHLTADDEVRQDFDSQSLKATQSQELSSGSIIEENYPGVHSDIGGGYPSKIDQGNNNNDLAKIYLKKMYNHAAEKGVPFMDYEKIKLDDILLKLFSIPIGIPLIDDFETIINTYQTKPGLQQKHIGLKEFQMFKEFILEIAEKDQSKSGFLEAIKVQFGWNALRYFTDKDWLLHNKDQYLRIVDQNISIQKQDIINTCFDGNEAECNEFLAVWDRFRRWGVHKSHWPFNDLVSILTLDDIIYMTPSIKKTTLYRDVFYNDNAPIDIKSVDSQQYFDETQTENWTNPEYTNDSMKSL